MRAWVLAGAGRARVMGRAEGVRRRYSLAGPMRKGGGPSAGKGRRGTGLVSEFGLGFLLFLLVFFLLFLSYFYSFSNSTL